MDALTALAIVRSGKYPLASIAKRLKSAGKSTKLALIATARTLLATLNAMIKNDQPYRRS